MQIKQDICIFILLSLNAFLFSIGLIENHGLLQFV